MVIPMDFMDTVLMDLVSLDTLPVPLSPTEVSQVFRLWRSLWLQLWIIWLSLWILWIPCLWTWYRWTPYRYLFHLQKCPRYFGYGGAYGYNYGSYGYPYGSYGYRAYGPGI